MYTLYREQNVNASLIAAWDFLKRPENLNLITPEDLFFSIVSEVPEEMHDGLIVEYRIKIPLMGRQRWVSEIKQIKEPYSFVDEQIIGPYKFWRHYHELAVVEDKVRSVDRVDYEVPFGMLGRLLHYLFIRKTLDRIFNYRKERLEAILTSPR